MGRASIPKIGLRLLIFISPAIVPPITLISVCVCFLNMEIFSTKFFWQLIEIVSYGSIISFLVGLFSFGYTYSIIIGAPVAISPHDIYSKDEPIYMTVDGGNQPMANNGGKNV